MDSELEQELKQRIDELQNGFVPPGPYQNDLIEVFTRCLEAIEWKSVEDELPEAGEMVAFRVKRHNEICIGFKDSDDPESNLWYDQLLTDRDGDYSDEYDVIHWRYITPKGEQ